LTRWSQLKRKGGRARARQIAYQVRGVEQGGRGTRIIIGEIN